MAVYPRWRGEHTDITEKNRKEIPVYPRWRRGTQNMLRERITHAVLSPLARGTLSVFPLFVVSLPVYPRWRGELSVISAIEYHTGLSRWRGNTNGTGRYSSQTRFIPAGAGNTAC